MRCVIIVFSVLFLFISLSSFSAEIDSFSKRYNKVEDSLDKINFKTNKILKRAIKKANKKLRKKEESCRESEKILYKAMRPYLKTFFKGKLSNWIMKAKHLDKVKVKTKKSIYKDFKWYQAIVPGFISRLKDMLAPLIKVNSVILGTDKFQHFLGSGYIYFKRAYLEEKGIDYALKFGRKAERSYLGAVNTGVFSYGDLAANFNGMRFWNHILQLRTDVLGEDYNEGPYIKCVDNQWQQVKDVNWAAYIDHAFDEGINCSQFRNKKMLSKVLRRISDLEDKDPLGRRYTCPVVEGHFQDLNEKYGVYAPQLINSIGHDVNDD